MNYNLELSDDVKKQLRKMDKHIAIMLSRAMQKELDGMENPRSKGKALVGQLKGLWRYRIGQYRVICEIQDDKLIVLALSVGHRKGIYPKG